MNVIRRVLYTTSLLVLIVLLNNSDENWIKLARLNTVTLSNKEEKFLITLLVFCSLHLRLSQKTWMSFLLNFVSSEKKNTLWYILR